MITRLLAGRRGPAIWLLSLMVIGIASLIPIRLPGSLFDKLLHFLAYFTLTILAFRVWALGPRPWMAIGLLLMVGAGIEIAQSHIAGREASWPDLASNILGICAAIFFALRRREQLVDHPGPRCVPAVRTAVDPKSYG